jgi:hypothetical protein
MKARKIAHSFEEAGASQRRKVTGVDTREPKLPLLLHPSFKGRSNFQWLSFAVRYYSVQVFGSYTSYLVHPQPI